jgi:hypothetical protein
MSVGKDISVFFIDDETAADRSCCGRLAEHIGGSTFRCNTHHTVHAAFINFGGRQSIVIGILFQG